MGITGIIAGGLGALGSIGSSIIGSNASKDAANAQAAAQERALQQQQQMFGVAQGALSPFVTAGQSVLPTLQGLITPGPNQNALLSQTPGFQFAQQYGNMAATNALAARGLGASAGPVATALSRQMLYRNSAAADPVEAHRVESLGIFYQSRGDAAEGISAFVEKRDPAFTGAASSMPPFYDDWISRT